MIKVKLISIMALALLFPFLLTGCWDRTEVSNLAIVIGIGVDRIPGNEPILLTVQIVNPSGMKKGKQGGGSEEQPFIVKTSQGKSVFDAVRNLSKELPRKMFFEHNKTVVLGKELAGSGISDVFDYMERNKEFNSTNYILVAEKTAKEVLGVKMEIEKLPSQSIERLMMNNSFTYPVNRNEFLLQLKYIGVSFAPLIQLADQKIHIEKTAVFKNYRLIRFLTVNESKALLWLINKKKEDTVIIPFKANGREEEVTIDIFSGSAGITPRITEKGITMEILCKGQATLREAGNTGIEVKEQELFRQLEQKTEKLLKKRVEQTINSAQRFNADFIGFANQIHNANPVAWKSMENDWDQYFPRIKYNVNFQIKIVNTGVFRSSVNEIR